jgi:molybdopterin synthase sulfur carrier subunit
MKTVHVEYYAALREQRGVPAEYVSCDAATVHDLYERLSAQHGLRFTPRNLRVAVNDAFVEWNHTLKDGDRVVFIPPVAGG